LALDWRSIGTRLALDCIRPNTSVSSGLILDHIGEIVYIWFVKSGELKRWLTKQGAAFTPAKGSHFRVVLNGKKSIIPMHQKDIPTGRSRPSKNS